MSNTSELNFDALEYLAADVTDFGDVLEFESRDTLSTLTLSPAELVSDGYLDADDIEDDSARAMAMAAAVLGGWQDMTPGEVAETLWLDYAGDDHHDSIGDRLDDVSFAAFNRPGFGFLLFPAARQLDASALV